MIFSRIRKARSYLAGEGLGPFLFKAMAASGAVRIGAMVGSFAVGVQLARMLGVEDFGYYGLALSIITIVGIPGEMGLPRLVTREVAAAASRDDMPYLFGVLRWAQRTAFRLSAIMAALAVAATFVVTSNHPSALAFALLLGAPTILFLSLARINGGALQGLQHVVRGQIPANLFRPLLLSFMLLMFQLLRVPIGPAAAMGLNSLTAGLALLLAYFWLRQRLPRPPRAQVVEGGRKWLASSIPMALTDGMRAFQSEVSTLLLGLLASPVEVGLFRIANVTANISSVGLLIVGHSIMPTIAQLYAIGDYARLQKLVSVSACIQLASVSLLAVPLIIFPDFLLSIAYGGAYMPAATALRILGVGQIISAAFGPNILLLNMSHNERRVTRAMGIALILNIATVTLLASVSGKTGAALGISLAVFVVNFMTWHDARRILSIDTSAIGAFSRWVRS